MVRSPNLCLISYEKAATSVRTTGVTTRPFTFDVCAKDSAKTSALPTGVELVELFAHYIYICISVHIYIYIYI